MPKTKNRKLTIAAPCGLYCGECELMLKKECKGCVGLYGGKKEWGECELYACVEKKGVEHCGECPDFVCKFFEGHNDPEQSPEDQKKGNLKRQKELRRRKKIGTVKWLKEMADKQKSNI